MNNYQYNGGENLMPLIISCNGDRKVKLYLPTIEEQTGWRRSNPLQILGDSDILQKVTSYSYDLLNLDFVKYAHQRGCMNGAGKPSPLDPDYVANDFDLQYEQLPTCGYPIRKFVREHWRQKEDFLSPSVEIYAAPVIGKKGKLLKSKKIEGDWKELVWETIPPARARLQDCWEVYLFNFCKII